MGGVKSAEVKCFQIHTAPEHTFHISGRSRMEVLQSVYLLQILISTEQIAAVLIRKDISLCTQIKL